MELVECWFFSLKLLHWFFLSWNWFRSWNFLCANFVREICWMLIFLFVKLVHWFFFCWNGFCSWSSLCVSFIVELFEWWFLFGKLIAFAFFSSLDFYIDFFLGKLILFMEIVIRWFFFFVELDTCWFLFVKLVSGWFFLFVEPLHWFFSS